MRRLSILVAAAAAAAVAVPSATPKGPVLVGIVGDRIVYQQLARFHATTLQPLRDRVPLDGHRYGWSFSPDNATLVLGDDNESCVGGSTTLRFVDVAAMRVLGDVPLVRNGSVGTTAWLDTSHVVAVAGAGDCIEQTNVVVAAVDARERRLLRSTTLPGEVVEVVQAPGRLVLLLAPRGRIGAARLAVVDALGNVRETALYGIRAGQAFGGEIAAVVHPGLAVDPDGGRPFVVPAGDRLAEIDLPTLRVRYRDTSQRRSSFARFRHWLDPPAEAKGSNGPSRQALWVGDGKLAVTGVDSSDTTRGGVTTMSFDAAGLRLVDTRTWKYRKLDEGISSVQLAGGLLLATGSSYSADGRTWTQTNAGLIAYDLDGAERYRLFPELSVGYATYAGHAYVTATTSGGKSSTFAFDARSGKTGRAVPTRALWRLLHDRAAS